MFGLRRIAEFSGYAKRLTIYTGSGPQLGRVTTLRPVLALACLRSIALSIGYAFSPYNGYPHQPFIVQALRGVVCVLFGYKVRVLSVLLGDWAVGLATKAYLPAVWSMGGRRVFHRQAPEHFMIELQGPSCCSLDPGPS